MSFAAQVAPADARADLEALRADLPRAEALLERREQEFRDARRSGATPERLEELAQRRDTAATLLEYHRADVEELERHVAELDAGERDERDLAAIAKATVTYRAAKERHSELVDEAERFLAEAIVKLEYLAVRAGEERSRASQAAERIAARRVGLPPGPGALMSEASAHEQRVTAEAHVQLARAVQGSEVRAIAPFEDRPEPWPRNPSRWPLLSQVDGNCAAWWWISTRRRSWAVRRRSGIWVFWHPAVAASSRRLLERCWRRTREPAAAPARCAPIPHYRCCFAGRSHDSGADGAAPPARAAHAGGRLTWRPISALVGSGAGGSRLELRQVRAVLSEAIVMLEHYVLQPAEDGEDVDLAEMCKLTHALAQAANTYRGLVEAERSSRPRRAARGAARPHAGRGSDPVTVRSRMKCLRRSSGEPLRPLEAPAGASRGARRSLRRRGVVDARPCAGRRVAL